MENNYNNYTTNHFNMSCKGQSLNSHMVHYDKPLYVIFGGAIHEMHAMLITNTYRYDEKKGDIINTYRIPLTGPELEPWEPRDMDGNLFVLPQDKQMHPADFRKYMNQMEGHSSVDEAIDELKRHQFIAIIPEKEVKFKVDAFNQNAEIESEWLHECIEMSEKGWIHPKDILPVFTMVGFLDKPACFVPYDTDDKDDISLTKEVKRMFDSFKDGLFMQYGKVFNDGTYTYTSDLGRIEMSHSEFLKKFPDAYTMTC